MGAVGMQIAPRFRDGLRGYIEELWSKYRWRHDEASYEDFLHASHQLIYQFILNQIEPAMNQPPVILTAEGDAVEPSTATFEVLDYALALAHLRAAEEFVEEEDDEARANNSPVEKSFTWYEAGESLALLRAHDGEFERRAALAQEQGGTRILGHLALTPEELRLDVTSRRRLNAGKQLLEQRLGGSIRHRETRVESLEQALARLPKKTKEEIEELPEELEALSAELAAQYHRQWLDTAVPALSLKTPREAVQTLGGRVQVIRLLKEFEQHEGRRAGRGEIRYDLDELKQELGLTDAEFLEEAQIVDQHS
jgi:hypothetical protein